MADNVSMYLWAEGDAAFGAPGLSPKWTSSSKDVVGTSYSAASKIWWTTSHGILNEIYFPTIDSPQTRDMELLFTDGESFFHEEKRDFETVTELIDKDALAIRITNTAPDNAYKVVKEVFSDPHYPTVLMRVRIEGDPQVLSKLRAFALLSPHLDVGGANNSGRGLDLAGQKVLVAWKDQTSLAFGVTGGFKRTSCGYAGASDGWQDLHQHHSMEWEFAEALNGNIAMMGEIDLSRGHDFMLGIALGIGNHGALSSLMQSLAQPPEQSLGRFIDQWHRVKTPENLAAKSGDKGRLLRLSLSMLLTHEDKTYAGAFIASASIPWGQAKGDEDLGGYHLVWTRDMVQTATALIACGKPDTARRALVYLACSQRSDGSFAQNFWVNGDPYWGGIQLDEVAFPIMLTWRLWKSNDLGDFDAYTFVMRAAGFLVRRAPVTQQERWEENPGYSPSTLAAVIAGLICAADIARAYGSEDKAVFLEEYADWIESHLDEWTTTTDGVLVPGIQRHYMRLRPPMCQDVYVMPGCEQQMLRLNNRAPGQQSTFEAREIIDAGFLELVRYGIRSAKDPLIVDSLKVVDAVLRRDTPNGPVWRRYNHDGYGTDKDGSPFLSYGYGGGWPLLGGERAHYELAAGNDIRPMIASFEKFASDGGMLPEQVWVEDDLPDEHQFRGKPSGSAMPLVWAHAEYIKLLRSCADGTVFDRIPVVADRYLHGKGRKDLEFFKVHRHVDSVAAGSTFRVAAGRPFQLTWTVDNWTTTHRDEATSVDELGWFRDIVVAAKQTEPILFTLYWPQEDRWEGTNYTVTVRASGTASENLL
jgi:glucoamylase